ncbi:MAG: toxin-antitoxin system YwqK family antitoxin [FCB group bacterium]|nr:toxin-antitoxin system YwqK family antitoxin [FCB group bacterium]
MVCKRSFIFLVLFIWSCGPVPRVVDRYPNRQKRVEELVIRHQGQPDEVVARITYYTSGARESETELANGIAQGKYISWYPNGQLHITGNFLQGKRDGKWKVRTRQGTLDSLIEYRLGELDGRVITYYSNGKKKRLIYFSNDVPNGSLIEWNTANKKTLTGEYLLGQRTGTWTWKSDGVHKDSVRSWLQGRPHGIWEDFYHDGTPSFKRFYQDSLLTGAFQRWYPDGSSAVKGSMNGNLRDGVWTWKNTKGKPDSVREYRNGLPNGKWIDYNTDGKPQWVRTYTDSLPDGTWKRWYPDGTKAMVGQFDRGRRTGTWTWYNEAGRKDSIREYLAGVPQGTWIDYTPEEKPWLTRTYQDSLLHGKWKRLYPEGEKAETGDFLLGKRNGEWTWWNRDGEIDSVHHYLNGNLDGKLQVYQPNGKLLREVDYRLGRKSGVESIWDSTGQIRSQISYLNDQRSGPYSFWSQNGILLEKGVYRDGIPAGLIRRWYETGTPMSESFYRDGKTVGRTRIYNPTGNISQEIWWLGKYKVCELEYHSQGWLKRVQLFRKGKVIYERTWNRWALETTPVNERLGIVRDEILYLSGNVKSESSHKDGVLHGLQREFDDHRNWLKMEIYDQGNLRLSRIRSSGIDEPEDRVYDQGVCQYRITPELRFDACDADSTLVESPEKEVSNSALDSF